jgi:hypothetical protein
VKPTRTVTVLNRRETNPNCIQPPTARLETNWNRFLIWELLEWSITPYGSLPRYVEQLTVSQQKLDGSLAIKISFWSPSLLNSINFLQSYTINQSEQSLEVPYGKQKESKISVELGKLLQQLVKLKQHQWPEV